MNTRFVLFLALVLFSFESAATASLDTWPDHWEVECSKSEDQARIEKMLREGVAPELKKIRDLNPELFDPLVEGASKRKVIFKCKDPGSRNAAAATSRSPFASKILLGQAWKNGWVDHAAIKIVVHELLHALGLDNLPVKIHNSDEKRRKRDEGIILADKDLVYSCVRTLYPGELDGNIYSAERTYSSCVIYDAYESCVSCLSGRLNAKGKPYVPPRSEAVRAQNACAEMQREFRLQKTAEINDFVSRGVIVLHPEGC